MRQHDVVPVAGVVTITARHASGLVTRETVRNTITFAGLNLIRDLLRNASSARLTHFAVGTSDTSPAATQTALGSEEWRDAITQTQVTNAAFTERLYVPGAQANGVSLTEVGLFTAASDGIMFSRATYSPITKTTALAITFAWAITLGGGA